MEVLDKTLADEVFAFLRDVLEGIIVEMVLSLDDVIYYLRLSASWEWYFTRKHYVEHHSHGPNVDFAVVVLQEDLWGHVIW